MKKAVALILTGLFATSAFAGATDSGFYVGGGFGLMESKLENQDKSIFPTFDGERSWRIYGGYAFNRIVSLEGGYTNYGSLSNSDLKGLKITPSAASLAANLGYTFDNGIRPFATVGLSRVNAEAKYSNHSKSDSATGFRYGIGVEYMPAQIDGLGVRLAYEADAFNVDMGGFDTDTFTVGSLYLGASYKF
ncbi:MULTISPECIES: porin family protein [Vibrio]|uniref:Porin family protein n=3 Tax=Vibrio TaxID=662 RepID=A0ABX5DEW0_9VIBR|nr:MULTISPECIES: porin family protein [Vibrio]MCG9658463.1 porin family protein [Vibrio mediterranei]PCD89405.1 porin family protein [Vibrio mediterranei]PRQ68234.1 porin family protein [Vibrio mediterranei]PTC04891.1 porin family protein [Vibrio mediterranei]SBO11046.1 outer membrane protein A [Vibrio mediterranei]